MSETRFTPGPWEADLEEGWVVRAKRSPEGLCYLVADLNWFDGGEEEMATAHLIAAAPTLYDTAAETVPALRRLIAEMNLGPDGEGRDWLDMLTACADDLDAAMAKARGEA